MSVEESGIGRRCVLPEPALLPTPATAACELYRQEVQARACIYDVTEVLDNLQIVFGCR